MDKTLSVTSARQQLLKLTKDVRRRMDRVQLTNKGGGRQDGDGSASS